MICFLNSIAFVERSIGLCQQEFLNHVLLWSAKVLAKKLSQYQIYYNETRAHSSLKNSDLLSKHLVVYISLISCANNWGACDVD